MGCVSCGTCFGCCSKTDVYDDNVVVGGEDAVVALGDDFVKDKSNNEEIVDETNNPSDTFSFGAASETTSAVLDAASDEENHTFAQKTLLMLARYLRIARWPLLALCVVSFALCCYFATTLKLPESSDVRLLGPNTEVEKAARWRKELLSSDLQNLGGSRNNVIWGVVPADTGVKSTYCTAVTYRSLIPVSIYLTLMSTLLISIVMLTLLPTHVVHFCIFEQLIPFMEQHWSWTRLSSLHLWKLKFTSKISVATYITKTLPDHPRTTLSVP